MEEDAETLRRRLYRPGASAADLAGYLHVTAAQERTDGPDEATAEVEPVPSLRPFAIGASVVAGAALLGGLLLSGALTPPTATPTSAAAASAAGSSVAVDATDGRVEFVTTDVLDDGAAAHARGDAVQEGPGRYRYTVADGDEAAAVAARFGLCAGDVLVALPYGVDPARLPGGMTVELARLTSTSC